MCAFVSGGIGVVEIENKSDSKKSYIQDQTAPPDVKREERFDLPNDSIYLEQLCFFELTNAI